MGRIFLDESAKRLLNAPGGEEVLRAVAERLAIQGVLGKARQTLEEAGYDRSGAGAMLSPSQAESARNKLTIAKYLTGPDAELHARTLDLDNAARWSQWGLEIGESLKKRIDDALAATPFSIELEDVKQIYRENTGPLQRLFKISESTLLQAGENAAARYGRSGSQRVQQAASDLLASVVTHRVMLIKPPYDVKLQVDSSVSVPTLDAPNGFGLALTNRGWEVHRDPAMRTSSVAPSDGFTLYLPLTILEGRVVRPNGSVDASGIADVRVSSRSGKPVGVTNATSYAYVGAHGSDVCVIGPTGEFDFDGSKSTITIEADSFVPPEIYNPGGTITAGSYCRNPSQQPFELVNQTERPESEWDREFGSRELVV